jgi:hypothetical protein
MLPSGDERKVNRFEDSIKRWRKLFLFNEMVAQYPSARPTPRSADARLWPTFALKRRNKFRASAESAVAARRGMCIELSK